jgi:hypothetical protein
VERDDLLDSAPEIGSFVGYPLVRSIGCSGHSRPPKYVKMTSNQCCDQGTLLDFCDLVCGPMSKMFVRGFLDGIPDVLDVLASSGRWLWIVGSQKKLNRRNVHSKSTLCGWFTRSGFPNIPSDSRECVTILVLTSHHSPGLGKLQFSTCLDHSRSRLAHPCASRVICSVLVLVADRRQESKRLPVN